MTTIGEIQRAVADHFGLTLADLIGPARDRKTSRPRQVAMWLCREITGKSMAEIGRAFRRDHTTVMHGLHAIDETTDGEIIDAMSRIRHRLTGFSSRQWVFAIPFKTRRKAA